MVFSAFLANFQRILAHFSAFLCKVFVLNFLKNQRISAHFFLDPGLNTYIVVFRGVLNFHFIGVIFLCNFFVIAMIEGARIFGSLCFFSFVLKFLSEKYQKASKMVSSFSSAICFRTIRMIHVTSIKFCFIYWC